MTVCRIFGFGIKEKRECERERDENTQPKPFTNPCKNPVLHFLPKIDQQKEIIPITKTKRKTKKRRKKKKPLSKRKHEREKEKKTWG